MGLFGKKKKKEEPQKSVIEVVMQETVETVAKSEAEREQKNNPVNEVPIPVEEKPEKKGFFAKLKAGLSKTGGGLLGSVFGAHEKIDDEFYDELEEAMILADMGMETVETIISELKSSVKENKLKTPTEAKEKLVGLLADEMRPEAQFLVDESNQSVILIVGVNGVGKTTSIGKLAAYYKECGKTVLMSAADTFRAAAAEQLTEWAKRADVPIVKHGEGADPAAVVYDSIASFKARNGNLLICDTAGRLHNKKNLMDELSKIRRVITRDLPEAPVEVLLVLDATTGQNALLQAQAFADSAGLTGLILTKLDGTAKGGVAVAIRRALNLPIRFVGVGEGIADMRPFDADDFAKALLG